MATEYIYKVVNEDFNTGVQGKRPKRLYTFKPLQIGGLYAHLGKGYPGCQRVLSEETREVPY